MNLCVVSNKIHPEDVQPNIVVPFTESGPIFSAVTLNLATEGFTPRLFRLQQTFSYDLLFRRLWGEAQPFIIVEQDILPWPGALVGLWKCDEPWCGHAYFVQGTLRSYLGCSKFDPISLGDCPLTGDLIEWALIDRIIEKALMTRGYQAHRHSPAVTHLNINQARMPTAGRINPYFWKAESL